MIIDLDTLFPVRKTFTDIVSYCTVNRPGNPGD